MLRTVFIVAMSFLFGLSFSDAWFVQAVSDPMWFFIAALAVGGVGVFLGAWGGAKVLGNARLQPGPIAPSDGAHLRVFLRQNSVGADRVPDGASTRDFFVWLLVRPCQT
jgi:hypothetical protein